MLVKGSLGQPRGCCNIGCPPHSHLQLNAHEMSSVYNLAFITSLFPIVRTILHIIRKWYCQTLDNTSKRLNNCYRCYEQTRCHRKWVQYEFWGVPYIETTQRLNAVLYLRPGSDTIGWIKHEINLFPLSLNVWRQTRHRITLTICRWLCVRVCLCVCFRRIDTSIVPLVVARSCLRVELTSLPARSHGLNIRWVWYRLE